MEKICSKNSRKTIRRCSNCFPLSAVPRLLSELNPFEPTIAYGLCDLGRGFPELGYVSLEELKSIQYPLLFPFH
ncbi:DUF2958 domain-containing protein [Runella sp. MFBS21]|uniref:DUF2958 domain-containing protein n=1 Tax=Runella sp. MFBS21 TaxID=3034018 RepID=UPI0038F6DF02